MPHMLHYFNVTLNKLNNYPDIEVLVVIPSTKDSKAAGGGINQTVSNAKFRVIKLREIKIGPYYGFQGMSKLLKKEKPDIILTDTIFMYPFFFNLYLRYIVKYLNIKIIMQSIPYMLATYEESYKTSGQPNRIDQLPKPLPEIMRKLKIEFLIKRTRSYINKLIFNYPDAHLNYIDEALDIYGSYGVEKEKIFVSYNSTDTDALLEVEKKLKNVDEKISDNKKRILHVGRLVNWKRVDLLINAVKKLIPEYPDIELIIIGEGPEKKMLAQQVKESNLEVNVKFTGGVYDSFELGKYFMSASVYVLAGVGGLSINDAMFYGLPIICSVCDGTEKKLVRDGYNGKYFIEGNVDDLSEKIKYIISSHDIQKKMGGNSRKIIDEEVNIHTVLGRWVDSFNYVLKN